MRPRPAVSPDLTTLVAGLLLVLLGVLLLLDGVGVLDLAPGTIGSALVAVLGGVLLVSGLQARRHAP